MNNTPSSARKDLKKWEKACMDGILKEDGDLFHTFNIYFSEHQYIKQLKQFSRQVAIELEPQVMENNQNENLPKLNHYSSIGERNDEVIHHHSYVNTGDIIYGTGLMGYLKKPGQMLKTLGIFLLSSHAGEAGHNCPIACSAGVMRILNQQKNFPLKSTYLEKLTAQSFQESFTGAQFLTEIQGGSDVGANAVEAFQDPNNQWRIKGEKWFCSNASAELILITARHNSSVAGTKGLGLFLIPAKLPDGSANYFKMRRLKNKIGTRSMATAEIEFESAVAYPMGDLNQGIHLVLEHVLHVSRIFNAFSVLGMTRRAFQIAVSYSRFRKAFKHTIIDFPLVFEALAIIKADISAMSASVFHMVKLQDEIDGDEDKSTKESKLLLRTLANINKYYTAQNAVIHIHHCIDILAGNGTIEDFSSLPRLLRDSIVCENWEGTHFVLWMQVLRDIHKFNVDVIFLKHLKNLLTQYDVDEATKLKLNKGLKNLHERLIELKKHPLDEQTLLFKPIIKKMGQLLATVCLTIEVQQSSCPDSKKAALELILKRWVVEDNMSVTEKIALYKNILIRYKCDT